MTSEMLSLACRAVEGTTNEGPRNRNSKRSTGNSTTSGWSFKVFHTVVHFSFSVGDKRSPCTKEVVTPLAQVCQHHIEAIAHRLDGTVAIPQELGIREQLRAPPT